MAAESEEKEGFQHWEVLFGVVLALFAAALAVCDLGAGKYGDDELMAVNEKAAAHMWYQSKSIKESLAEGQSELLATLLETGSIGEQARAGAEAQRDKLHAKAERYGREKTEILKGSAAVGKENQVQEKDGELGRIIGADEWQKKAEELGRVGDVFDMGTLYLQMCLVLGAIGLVVHVPRMKVAFFLGMLSLGLLGSYQTWAAYSLAWAMG